MKKDWFATFLPIWALGSVAWITAGFIIYPDAWARPLLGAKWELQQPMMADLTIVDWPIAGALAIIVGPTVVALVVAIAIAATQQRRERRRNPAPYR